MKETIIKCDGCHKQLYPSNNLYRIFEINPDKIHNWEGKDLCDNCYMIINNLGLIKADDIWKQMK